MKRNLIIIFFLGYYMYVFATDFVSKGYIIDKDSIKYEGYIRFINDEITPTSIFFSTSEFGIFKEYKPSNIIAFKYKNSYFYSNDIEIETSTSFTPFLSQDPSLNLKVEKNFIELMIEGDKNLFVYKLPNKKLYYFGEKNKPQLLYSKLYIKRDENKRYKTVIKTYINQLKKYFGFSDVNNTDLLNNTKYESESLIQLYREYYLKKNSTPDFITVKNKGRLQVNILAGAMYSNYNDINSEFLINRFTGNLSPIFGFSFNFVSIKHLWSTKFEFYRTGNITQYGYVNNYINSDYYTEQIYNSDYYTISSDIYLHYPILYKKNELFLNGGFYSNLPIFKSNKVTIHRKFYSTEETNTSISGFSYYDAGFLVGMGIKKEKFGIELRCLLGPFSKYPASYFLTRESIMVTYDF